MNKLYLFSCVVAANLLSACGSHSEGHVKEAEGHDHGDEIILHKEEAEKFGVKTEKIYPDTFYEVINVAGQIELSAAGNATVVAPKAGTVNFANGVLPGMAVSTASKIASISSTAVAGGDASVAAKARIESAKKELDRLSALLPDGIVTKQQVNQAQAEYNQALAAYSPAAAGGIVRSPVSGVITALLVSNGAFVDAGQPIATVSKSNQLTLRADVPSRYFNMMQNVSDGNIRPAGSESWIPFSSIGAKKSGEAPAATASGYIPLYFSIDNNGSLVPGSYAEVALKCNPRGNIIAVPAAAVTEQQGTKFVYARVDEDGYNKIPVTTGASDGVMIEILSGINPGDEIVCQGVTFVKLAESSGAVPEGHSHNH
ncbi:MAG: efflux RND transporter periplasmic adaptor subunit [Muribaculaceae bacterium]|nr:efflux RND transporter periplasmic adaptor subunit [Muribaculaceae bacterium]